MHQNYSLEKLVTSQYLDHEILAKRKTFHRLEDPYIYLPDEIFKRLNTQKSQAILDIGCGNGDILVYLAEHGIKGIYTGIDISPGMLKEAEINAQKADTPMTFVVANAEMLPFSDASFDAVTAKFSLHCVENIPRAINEIYRVLKPGGKFVIVCRSNRSQKDFDEFRKKLAEKFGLRIIPNMSSRFTLETLPDLVKNFYKKEFASIETVIRITEPELFVDYLSTYRTHFEPTPSEKTWTKILEMARAEIQKIILEHGEYAETIVHGVTLCTK